MFWCRFFNKVLQLYLSRCFKNKCCSQVSVTCMWTIRWQWSSCPGWGWWCSPWGGGPTPSPTARCSTLPRTLFSMSESRCTAVFCRRLRVFEWKKVLKKVCFVALSVSKTNIVTWHVLEYHESSPVIPFWTNVTVEYGLQRNSPKITRGVFYRRDSKQVCSVLTVSFACLIRGRRGITSHD